MRKVFVIMHGNHYLANPKKTSLLLTKDPKQALWFTKRERAEAISNSKGGEVLPALLAV